MAQDDVREDDVEGDRTVQYGPTACAFVWRKLLASIEDQAGLYGLLSNATLFSWSKEVAVVHLTPQFKGLVGMLNVPARRDVVTGKLKEITGHAVDVRFEAVDPACVATPTPSREETDKRYGDMLRNLNGKKPAAPAAPPPTDPSKEKSMEIYRWLAEQAELWARGTSCDHDAFVDDCCKSPIEKLLGQAMLARFASDGLGYGLQVVLPGYGPEECSSSDWVTIEAQKPVGNYRADFYLVRHARRTDGRVAQSPGVVIECDGHDFHERTKEQAEHDRARDRFMQEQGLCVLRFTGSEIWRDALCCADQIGKFLGTKVLEAHRAMGEAQR